MTADLIQGSAEWLQARCGLVTASRISDLTAKTKTGYGASRANYMAQLIAERLTGLPQEGYLSPAMQWGTNYEAEARAAYEFYRDASVKEVGFIKHPEISESGASPDGFVTDKGLVEIKCPQTATHIDTLLGNAVPGKYVQQMQFQMACTGREWVDFVSYDPRMPENMRLFVARITRDPVIIGTLESEVKAFLSELNERIRKLRSAYDPQPILMAG